MFEKVFGCLLRLYPARFRQQYGNEAVGLLRDRFRDERGAARRLRLCFDLLIDFTSGLPQAYRNSGGAPAAQPANGIPAFTLLHEEPLRPGSILLGSACAVAALAGFILVMNHASAYHPFARLHGLPNRSPGQASPSSEEVADRLNEQIQAAGAPQTCGFDKLELHPGNIGYVKLNWFADPLKCGAIVQAVMDRLNSTDAIIFDLRDNHGGFPETVRMVADYLFDRPNPWYNPRASSPEQSFTRSPALGSRLAHTPVFILISSRTFSAGEHFTHNLKALHRAIIVGETTSGASHGSGPPPEGTKPVWEGSGVAPNVKVSSPDALRIAERMAPSELRK